MKICHIDTETTGLTREHAVIQIAGVICTPKLEEPQPFNYLLAPFDTDAINDEALKVNRRTEEEILGFENPRKTKQAFCQMLASHVNKFEKQDKLLFAAYNAQFDGDMMRAFFEKCGDKFFGSWFFFPLIDTAMLAMIMLGKERKKMHNFKLVTVCDALGIDLTEDMAHDALADVLASKAIFDMFVSRYGITWNS